MTYRHPAGCDIGSLTLTRKEKARCPQNLVGLYNQIMYPEVTSAFSSDHAKNPTPVSIVTLLVHYQFVSTQLDRKRIVASLGRTLRDLLGKETV
ncbi:hypothetical protein TNCV_4133101 [Trichonephila clavipes]|nr:hypothetical protein TNCV_4133101 [Trichonephila clavipes]